MPSHSVRTSTSPSPGSGTGASSWAKSSSCTRPSGRSGEHHSAVRQLGHGGNLRDPDRSLCRQPRSPQSTDTGCGVDRSSVVTSRRGAGPRRRTGAAPRREAGLVGRRVAERDGAEGTPALRDTEVGEDRRLVVEQAEEAARRGRRRPRRAARAPRPCRRRPTSTARATRPRPSRGRGRPCPVRRSARSTWRHARSAMIKTGAVTSPGKPKSSRSLGGQRDVPVAGGLLGALEDDEGGALAVAGRAARAGPGRSARRRPRGRPVVGAKARTMRRRRTASRELQLGPLRELGEVFGHRPAEGHERVASLGVEALEEGGHVGAGSPRASGSRGRGPRGGCRCPWPRRSGRRRPTRRPPKRFARRRPQARSSPLAL